MGKKGRGILRHSEQKPAEKGRKFEPVGVQMDETGMQGGEGKLIKTEARLMFVGGILMHSRGDTTPSSLLPVLASTSIGISIQTLIDDGTCRGIRIKAPLTLPSTVAKEGCQGGGDGGICVYMYGTKFDFWRQ